MVGDDAPPPGRRPSVHTLPTWFGRPLVPAVPVPPPQRTNFDPVAPPGRPARAHLAPFFTVHPGIAQTVIAPFGAAGAATFVLLLEPGAKITFSWSTAIITSYSGKEQRESLLGPPKRKIEGSAFLLDGADRDIRGALMRGAAAGATYLIGLPFEELTLVADSSAQTVFVVDAINSDWLKQGQRVAVIGPDGFAVIGAIQVLTSTTIRLDVTPGAAGRAGGRIMPLLQAVLEPQQGFARYPVAADLWSVHATATIFGWTGADTMGISASIATFTNGGPVPLNSITDFDLLVWDRGSALQGTTSQSMIDGAEIVDLGGAPVALGASAVPGWSRSVRYSSTSVADWQWFKAFIRLVRGRQRSFGLSTNEPDLVYAGAFADGMKVGAASAVGAGIGGFGGAGVGGAGDYTSWFASEAHRRLAITNTLGAVQYVEVISVLDNLDGTLSLTLDSGVSGTPAKISFLEIVRFDRDDIEAVWDGGMFTVDEPVRTILDETETPSKNLFDKEVALDFRYTGIPPDLPPTTQTLQVPVGKTILVHWTSDRSLNFNGIHMAGGNVDQTVVCVSNANTTSSSIILNHEDTHATASDRIQNAGLSANTGVAKASWYRYRAIAGGGTGRWAQIG